jgi:hypothetical protein
MYFDSREEAPAVKPCSFNELFSYSDNGRLWQADTACKKHSLVLRLSLLITQLLRYLLVRMLLGMNKGWVSQLNLHLVSH